MDKIPATTQVFLAQIMKFPDFSRTSLIFKISLTNLQNSDFSLTLKKNQISLTFPWPVATPKNGRKQLQISPYSNVTALGFRQYTSESTHKWATT